MIIIKMKVLAKKYKELSQTILSLTDSIRLEKGCLRCDFCRSIEDENELFLLEEWDVWDSLDNHFKSDYLKVLRGAVNLLQEPYEIIYYSRHC